MKFLILLLMACTACGIPYLEEGLYEVTLIETSNSCGWPNGDTGLMTWAITNVGKRYGITHMANGETLACTQSSEDHDIYCSKDKNVLLNRCNYFVVQNVVMEPQQDSFTGTFAIDFMSCINESCGQKAVIKGEWYQQLPVR